MTNVKCKPRRKNGIFIYIENRMKKNKYKISSIIIIYSSLLLYLVGFLVLQNAVSKNISEHKKETIYFGSTYMTMNNPYFNVINNEIKECVEANRDVLITMDPVLSLERQIEQIEYLIDEGVKVIFLNPVNKSGLHDVLEKCRLQNIKVIVLDTNVEEEDYYSTMIVSDNYDAGVQAAQDMMSRKDSARILLLKHSEAASGYARIQGFIDTIKKHPQYEIVASGECKGQLELAMPTVENFLNEGVHFDVVMALNDPAAMGCLAALQEAGKENVLVYGVDGTPDCKQLISNGKMHASIAQSPLTIGDKAVEAAYALLDGKKIDKEQVIPVHIINTDNIDEYDLGGWQ